LAGITPCSATIDPDRARDAWQTALTIFDQLDHPAAQGVRTKPAAIQTQTDRRILMNRPYLETNAVA
jgi:hypothetical protein